MYSKLASSPSAYRQSAVMTASPEQLVVMLYDGARRFLGQATAAMRAGDVETAHVRLRRAEAIISHLRDTLDLDQGDVADRLQAIYLFCNRHLNDARVQRDPQKIEQVNSLLGELRSAWSTVAGV
jgi:flagellar secretion chaperone FliS